MTSDFLLEISYWKQCKQEDNEATCLNYRKKIKTLNLEVYTWQKHCPK